ncbi:terpenoid synthase [Armillaria nabsnona]|nr:terpenoid synthase [Armillaria nabsnona]
MAPQSDVVFRIPDTLAYWPWLRRSNPHYEEVKAASEAWFRSFKAFGPRAQSAFDHCNFSLLCSLAYPTATKEHLRTTCDMMNLFFVFGEYTDNAPPEIVRQYADIVMDAIRDPTKPRPSDEVVLGLVAQEFWGRGVKSASKTSQKRFVEAFGHYTAAVVEQAKDRHHRYIRNIDDYFDDLASYNKEQALEEYPHNIIISVMNELKCDHGDALSWVEDHHRLIRTKFLTLWTEIPSWGPDTDVLAPRYLHGTANWVPGDCCWSFESQRYFGSNGRAVQEHRLVTLVPKQFSMSEPLLVHSQ